MQQVPLFKDRELDEALFNRGYITLPFLNEEEVAQLKELFYKYHSEEDVHGIHVSSHVNDNDTIAKINDSIRAIFKRAIEEHIDNGQTLGGTFISKGAQSLDALEPHQDWSIVDESRFRSYTIWVPLVDTNNDNGCLYVLPYSHDYVRGYRHLTIPSVFGPIYQTVWENMTPIHLKAGEAVVFDHAIGHASTPNKTDQVRIAATHSLIYPNAEMRFYWNNNGTVEEYLGENGFYNSEEAKSGPGNLKKIRDLDFQMHQLNDEEFYTLAGIVPPQPASVASADKERGLVGWFKKLIS